jgi:predicted nucleic acid-binding Zn ribbon protein
MRKTKHRICLGCNQPFLGRVDAKTCSAKCRKRFERARLAHQQLLDKNNARKPEHSRNYVAIENLRGQYATR